MKEKEAKRLLQEFFGEREIHSKLGSTLKPPIELAKANDKEIFLFDLKPILARMRNRVFPTLSAVKLLSNMPKVIVDMGAIPNVCNGADIMAPGIVSFEGTFDKEDLVVVFDERHRTPLAVTIALYSTEEAKRLDAGKILKNIHYVGDDLWKMLRQLPK